MSDNDAGLSIIYKGGYVSDLAICIDPTELFYGWLLARNPLDGRWVSLTKIGANATTLYEARNRIAELEAELVAERERWEEAEGALNKRENDLMLLRNAVEAMMAPLGYHGEISARDDRVQSVMDALAYLDTTPARQTSA